MRRALVLFTFFIGNCLFADDLPVVPPESAGFSSERLQKVGEFVARNIEEGKHAGIVTIIARHGEIVHFEAAGKFGVNSDKAMRKDTLFRIFSMTKPITSVAMMMLYEEGRFQLNEPVSRYLPEMADMQVYKDGQLQDSKSPMLIEHLFTHTAGLSYGFLPDDPVDGYYQSADIWNSVDLDEFIGKLGSTPLRYEPGEQYYYSVATDVLGALVERISGQSLEAFFNERIFGPLGMRDTFFSVPEDQRARFAENHVWDYELARMQPLPDQGRRPYKDTTLFSGGGGLVSSAMDYMRFCEMLRNGGSYNGARLLGPKTVQYMRIGHLPEGLTHGGPEGMADTLLYPGQSFGLGFAVIEQPGLSQVVSSRGEYSWGGAADTKFWIDPEEDLVAILMTQLMRSPHETRYQMKVATYQALTQINGD